MNNNKERKKSKVQSFLAVVAIIGLLISVVFLSTYSFWQITKTQEDVNKMISACLNLTYTENTNAIKLTNVWPSQTSLSPLLDGYSFSLTNTCDKDLYYTIGLDAIENEGESYLNHENVMVSIDNTFINNYASFNTVTSRSNGNVTGKDITTLLVPAHETNTHTLRLWIRENSPITEQNKIFRAQIVVNAINTISKSSIDNSLFNFDQSTNTITGANLAQKKSVYIPSTIQSVPVLKIGTDAFRNSKLDNVIIENGIASISAYAFSYQVTENYGGLSSIVIPESVNEISEYAFYKSGLRNVHISKNVKNISAYAFSDNRIDHLELKEGLLEISESAFENNNLTEVTIPSSVTKIGDNAFNNNPGLKKIIINKGNSEALELGANWSGNATVVYAN